MGPVEHFLNLTNPIVQLRTTLIQEYRVRYNRSFYTEVFGEKDAARIVATEIEPSLRYDRLRFCKPKKWLLA